MSITLETTRAQWLRAGRDRLIVLTVQPCRLDQLGIGWGLYGAEHGAICSGQQWAGPAISPALVGRE